MIARQGNKMGEKGRREETERTTERRNKQTSKEKERVKGTRKQKNISDASWQGPVCHGHKMAQNGAFHTWYTLYTGSCPPALFITLFQLRLGLCYVYSFCWISLSMIFWIVCFILLFALPFQDCKDHHNQKRKLPCIVYCSHYPQLFYPLHVHIILFLLFLLLLVECVA